MSNQQETKNVSPKSAVSESAPVQFVCKSTCAQSGKAVDEWEIMEGEEEEDMEEEGRVIRGPQAIYKPSQEEWDNHMKSHIPFRRWCPLCVKGSCKSGAHQSSNKHKKKRKRKFR